MIARARLVAVVTIVAGGAIAIIASTQTWLSVILRAGTADALLVPGASALPLLAPLALAALALGLALSVVGRVLRYVFGVIAAVIGGALVVGSLRVGLTHPLDAVAGVFTTTTGLSGTAALEDLVAAVTGTAWPFVTALAGLAIAAGGLVTVATAYRWRSTGRRYQQGQTGGAITDPAATGRPHDAIDSWDELSHGEDPTAR